MLRSQQANNANRPFVLTARIHDDRIKELITQLAKQQAPLMYQGQHIQIFPDFPSDIMKQLLLFVLSPSLILCTQEIMWC